MAKNMEMNQMGLMVADFELHSYQKSVSVTGNPLCDSRCVYSPQTKTCHHSNTSTCKIELFVWVTPGNQDVLIHHMLVACKALQPHKSHV